jgi:transcriptional regulator with XRE-family HTH domain
VETARKARAVEVDRLVGARIRARRIALGLSQLDLAGLIGCTYQQLHKYERGINRLAATRLFLCAEALRVSVDYFFEREGTLIQRERMMLDLARMFNEITDERVRLALAMVAASLAGTASPGELAAVVEPGASDQVG